MKRPDQSDTKDIKSTQFDKDLEKIKQLNETLQRRNEYRGDFNKKKEIKDEYKKYKQRKYDSIPENAKAVLNPLIVIPPIDFSNNTYLKNAPDKAFCFAEFMINPSHVPELVQKVKSDYADNNANNPASKRSTFKINTVVLTFITTDDFEKNIYHFNPGPPLYESQNDIYEIWTRGMNKYNNYRTLTAGKKISIKLHPHVIEQIFIVNQGIPVINEDNSIRTNLKNSPNFKILSKPSLFASNFDIQMYLCYGLFQSVPKPGTIKYSMTIYWSWDKYK